jgi:hypothetical protein
MIRVDVLLADPAGLLAAGAFGAGALIRVERSATIAGSYAEVGTVAIDVTTQLTAPFVFWDAAGLATSYYRWRISNAGNTVQSPYSDPALGINPVATGVLSDAYAALTDVVGLFETWPLAKRLNRLTTLLRVATDQVIDEFDGRDFFRHPASGSATWLADGNGSASLHVHGGLVALDALELSFDGGLTYVPVTASDYMLRGDSQFSAEPLPSGEPYFHIRFTAFGQYTNFPRTHQSVRLTGARGWPAIPTVLREATSQRVRQLAAAGATYSGSDAGGSDDYGPSPTTDRFWPQSMWNFLKAERNRFIGCSVGRS